MTGRTVLPYGARQWYLLASLFAERGLAEGDYALFFTTGEGESPPISEPDDSEASGEAVAARR